MFHSSQRYHMRNRTYGHSPILISKLISFEGRVLRSNRMAIALFSSRNSSASKVECWRSNHIALALFSFRNSSVSKVECCAQNALHSTSNKASKRQTHAALISTSQYKMATLKCSMNSIRGIPTYLGRSPSSQGWVVSEVMRNSDLQTDHLTIA